MNTCPKCKQEIETLICLRLDITSYEFDGKIYVELDREADPLSELVYSCSFCGAALATGEVEAKKFLRGE